MENSTNNKQEKEVQSIIYDEFHKEKTEDKKNQVTKINFYMFSLKPSTYDPKQIFLVKYHIRDNYSRTIEIKENECKEIELLNIKGHNLQFKFTVTPKQLKN